MTSTNTNNATIAPFADAAKDDPRQLFGRALGQAADVMARVTRADLTRPTPCDGFDVAQLTGHLVSVVRALAAAGRGEDAMTVPDVVPEPGPGGWSATFAAAVDEVAEALADEALLGRMLELGWATLPTAVAVAIYTSEVTTHTWDLAVAIGATVAWDEEIAVSALATMAEALPADPRGGDVPFGPVVATPPGAAAIDRLVAWTGRTPAALSAS